VTGRQWQWYDDRLRDRHMMAVATRNSRAYAIADAVADGCEPRPLLVTSYRLWSRIAEYRWIARTAYIQAWRAASLGGAS
jgi:hypothetical protein